MTTTSDILARLLQDSGHFGDVRQLDDLIGTVVNLRVTTGFDDYDVIATSIASARLRIGDISKSEWLELTFPAQFVTCNLARSNRWAAYRVLYARKYAGDKHWKLEVKRSLLGSLGYQQSLTCHIRPRSANRIAAAA